MFLVRHKYGVYYVCIQYDVFTIFNSIYNTQSLVVNITRFKDHSSHQRKHNAIAGTLYNANKTLTFNTIRSISNIERVTYLLTKDPVYVYAIATTIVRICAHAGNSPFFLYELFLPSGLLLHQQQNPLQWVCAVFIYDPTENTRSTVWNQASNFLSLSCFSIQLRIARKF